MDVFAKLAQQISGTGLPLYAVTLTAVPHPDTPVLLMLHWHGFGRSPTLFSPSLAPPIRSVPGSAVQLNERWHDMGALESAMLDAAWQLGAWDVERVQRRGCNDVAARSREAHECRQAFGVMAEAPEHEIGIVDEAPDRAELMALGARRGYIRWLFRPVHGGLNEAPYDDESLQENGRRAPPCPVQSQAPFGWSSRTRPDGARHVFRLGRGRGFMVIR